MRSTISTNLSFGRYLSAGIAVLLLSWIAFGNINLKTKGAYLIGIVAMILAYRYCKNAKQVEYDDENMFILSRNEEEVVPLENIIKIKLTMHSINYSNFWKISYTTFGGTVKSVRFLPNSNFKIFKETVKLKNDSVKIRNWSHSFDFDQ